MSADSAITYTSVHSEARFKYSVCDPTREACPNSRWSMAPCFAIVCYLIPIELEIIYLCTFQSLRHREDLVPAEDEPPTPPLPPFFYPHVSDPHVIEPPAQMRANNTNPTYHHYIQSGTTTIVPITTACTIHYRKLIYPEALHSRLEEDPLWPIESIYILQTLGDQFQDNKMRMMTRLRDGQQEGQLPRYMFVVKSSEFLLTNIRSRRIVQLRDEIKVEERENFLRARSMNPSALTRSEAYCRALEARVTILETEVRRHEWQRQAADDFAVWHIMRTQALEAGDTASRRYRSFVLSSYLKMAPKRRTTRLNPGATPTPVTDTHTTTSVTNAQIQAMINEGITTALAACDATRNGDDSHTSGMGARRPMQVARECTYPDFLKCQPLNFKGTKGVVRLTQWFEKIESVYSISNCTVACQVKFATCTLQGNALTWWNSHVKTTTPEAAHTMPWRTLKKIMTDKYCPRGEIKKLEFEMCNLKVKESDKVEKYVGGLPDMIHGSVMATKPKTMQDAIEFATELMDKKISTFAERQAKNKRKLDNNNQAQQQLPKKTKRRQNVVQAIHWTGEKKSIELYTVATRHYRSDCLKLKNGNQARGTETRGRVFALVGGETNQDFDDKEDNTNA
ncbi:putative reverse transcriptase domain-containing protein [Tanacetum coccineum]